MADQEKEREVPHEELADQRIVDFEGDKLLAARAVSGGIYISIPNLCRALGLDTNGQEQRLKRTHKYLIGMRQFDLKTRGGIKPVHCLIVGKVASWLADVDTDRMKNRKAAAKIEIYQERLEPIATQVFLQTMSELREEQREVLNIGTSPTIPVSDAAAVISLLQDHIRISESLDGKLDVIQSDVQYIMGMVVYLVQSMDQTIELLEGKEQRLQKVEEKTQGLTAHHTYEIQRKIAAIVHASEKIGPKIEYQTIYWRLNGRFRVSKYSQILDEQFDTVMTWLDTTFLKPSVQQGKLLP